MRVARFWARRHAEIEGWRRDAWGSSDASEAEAAERAQAKADRLAAEIHAQDDPSLHHYEYQRLDQPEPIVEDVTTEAGERIGAITINRYGASVLNTASLAFVDVDLAPARKPGWLERKLTGWKPDDGGRALDALRSWGAEDSGRGARVYRTFAGLRYLLPAPALDPASSETGELMHRLGCDELYARLCRFQGSFRARLTPKPWRLDIASTPKLPYDKLVEQSEDTRAWLRSYEEASRGFAVCELIEEVGQTRPPNHDVARLIAMHDEWSGVGSGRPLA
ncbi:MAG: hypothetical protein AAFX79_04145 [Planctomycetota bacterium]